MVSNLGTLAAVRWIAENALPLTGVEPGTGYADLAPLREWIGDARIVGLGEQTHGTREFFRLKHRMVEYLVAELGFTLFLIEAGFPESLAVNRYVLTGEGDLRHSLASLAPYYCNCEEVVELVEWMRRWNATHDRKVHFHGIDLQTSSAAAIFLLDYLRAHHPSVHERLREPLTALTTDMWIWDWHGRTEAEKENARVAAAAVMETLAAAPAGTDAVPDELTIARLHAAELVQHIRLVALDQWDVAHQWDVRDSAMADNVLSVLDLHPPDARAVLWAHNGHIERRSAGEFGTGRDTARLGSRLAEVFGDRYFAFGFAFGHGGFNAIDLASRRVRPCELSTPPESLNGVLAQPGLPHYALNLRDADGAVADWFATAPAWLNIGGVWGPGLESWQPVDVRTLFDGVLFVRETSASHHNAGYTDEFYRREPAHPEFVNLDFGAALDGWWSHDQPAVGAYRVDVAADGGGLEMSRAESLWPGDAFAVRQAASARPWRGGRITVRCQASMDAHHAGGSAQLALRVVTERDTPSLTDLADVRPDVLKGFFWQRSLTGHAERRELQVTADVADDAETVELALVITGDGRARFGPITIENTAAADSVVERVSG